MECLNDGTPELRDAAFSALATIAKLVGMRPLERSLEKLDDVRRKKLSEMISGSEDVVPGVLLQDSSEVNVYQVIKTSTQKMGEEVLLFPTTPKLCVGNCSGLIPLFINAYVYKHFQKFYLLHVYNFMYLISDIVSFVTSSKVVESMKQPPIYDSLLRICDIEKSRQKKHFRNQDIMYFICHNLKNI